jgi:hypothetical protein
MSSEGIGRIDELTRCEVKIPKSGKKLINIGGVNLFVRPKSKLLFIYEVTSGVLITVCPDENKHIAFKRILERLDEVKAISCIS